MIYAYNCDKKSDLRLIKMELYEKKVRIVSYELWILREKSQNKMSKYHHVIFTTGFILLINKKHYKTPLENLKGTSGELIFAALYCEIVRIMFISHNFELITHNTFPL